MDFTSRDLKRKNGKPLVPQKRNNYILAIAIDRYEFCPKLNNAVYDVEAFIKLLIERYDVNESNINFLKDSEATKRKIEQAFHQLIKLITPQDNLIIYFSGHGHFDNRSGGYWIPVEANNGEDHLVDYLPNNTVKNFIDKINSFHTFLIVDSCFSGTFFEGNSKSIENRLDTEQSRWALTSGRNEIVSDGVPGKHSPFANALLNVLRKANQDLIIPNLCYSVVEKVASNANQVPKTNPLHVQGNQGGQMVLYLRQDENKDWNDTVNRGSIDGFRQFIIKYPKSENFEEAYWQLTKLQDSVQSYNEYEKKFGRNAKHYDACYSRLSFFEEEENWRNAEKSNTISSYKNYLDRFSDGGRFCDIAQQRISDLKRKLITDRFKHLAPIEDGTFEMGNIMQDEGGEDERLYTVTLSSFWIARQAVTINEFKDFWIARNLESDDNLGKHPIVNVSWYDAVDYCNWRSKKERLIEAYTINGLQVSIDWDANGYRLPTEAEWEYAARGGGKKVRFGNGEDFADLEKINFMPNDEVKYSRTGEPRRKTVPVGSLKSPNDLGLYDMSGNTWEWCWDWYGAYPTHQQPDPRGVENGTERVVRGGSWYNFANSARVSCRMKTNPLNRHTNVGFRLAKTNKEF